MARMRSQALAASREASGIVEGERPSLPPGVRNHTNACPVPSCMLEKLHPPVGMSNVTRGMMEGRPVHEGFPLMFPGECDASILSRASIK